MDPETRYRTLLEQIPAIVYIWDVSGGLENIVEEYVSPQIERVLGFSADEWMADPQLWVERIHPDDRDDVLNETSRSADAGDPFKLEYRMIARDGHVVWLHDVATVLPRDDGGRSFRYQGVQLDITDRKLAEHAQRRSFERLERLEEDRRQLLARLVAREETERRRIAEILHDETMQALSALLTRLGEIARSHPEIERFEGFPVVREGLSDVIGQLSRQVIEVHPRILEIEGLAAAIRTYVESWDAPDTPALDFVDHLTREPPDQIRGLLYRLAQEALENVREHSGASRVAVSLEEADGGFSIRIEDNGMGFDIEQTEASEDKVGLAAMRERAEAAGGRCTIQSSIGAGTRVEVWLPDPGSPKTARSRSSEEEDLVAEGDVAADEASTSEAHEIADLTPREMEVAQLLALGHTNVEIGAILHLSFRTIEQHRARVFRKLGVRSRAALVQRLRAEERPPDAT